MSAAADKDKSVMSGGNSTVANNSHLDEPTDAVPMESMPQPQPQPQPQEDAKPSNDETKIADKTATDAMNNGTDNVPDKAEEADVSTAMPSSKGKEKETVPQHPLDRQDSMAIGPAQDEIKAVTPGVGDGGPVCNITLLLTTGSRHPYKLDGRYLSKRGVSVPEKTEDGQPDPFSISIYTLKELILREWRSDWETKPASPSSIRLIHFGKLLDDKEPLKTYNFLGDSPNVVHMSVRPQDLDEEEPKTGGKNASGTGGDAQRERSGGCCVVL